MTTPTAKNSIDQAKLHRESMAIAPQAPGIIPFMEEEVVNFEGESASFQAGEQDNAEFTPFRLKQGVYGQRQADVQMIRVKIPGGILNAASLDGWGPLQTNTPLWAKATSPPGKTFNSTTSPCQNARKSSGIWGPWD